MFINLQKQITQIDLVSEFNFLPITNIVHIFEVVLFAYLEK